MTAIESQPYSPDHAAALVGIIMDEVRPGYAKGRLTIGASHLNGMGKAHGGIVFLLADTVFAYACNARGVQTVGGKCDITYHLPSSPEDVLTATGSEVYLKGRNGLYDVVVTNQSGEIVAHFRGHSVALKT